MQLLALDAEFQPVAYLPYLNLQWQREYYSPGKFSVQLAAEDYDPRMAIFTHRTGPRWVSSTNQS